MIFSDIKAQQLGYIITAKQFRGAPKLGYSWYQKAKASDQPLHFFAFFGALQQWRNTGNTSAKQDVILLKGN